MVDNSLTLDEGKRLFKVGKETGEVLTKVDLLQNIDEMYRLIGELSEASRRSSDVQKMMAENKSLRQSDNPEGRKDLYSHPTPSQTLEGRAATMLTAVLLYATGMDELPAK